jgi:hypothetical protein
MSGEDESTRLVEAFLKDSEMRELQAYLSAGRRFKDASEEILKRDWVSAFRALIKGDQDLSRDLDDLGAELRFRGVGTPDDIVRDEGAEAVRRLEREGRLDTESARQKIVSFLEDLRKPPN